MRMLTLMLAGVIWGSLALPAQSAEPINPNASEKAKQVLAYLHSIQGQSILAGQHLMYGSLAERDLAYVVKHTGKYPALVEYEAGIFETKYHEDYMKRQKQLVERAKAYWNEGGLIAMCWHWGNPLKTKNTYENTKVKFDIQAALRQGTPEHEALIKDLDITAQMLKALQDENIPVLWRPLHEFGGGWFWWSMQGKEPAQRLWQFIYRYYTDHHQLNNLLWVYSASQKLQTDWFPGKAYADIVGVDIYTKGEKDNRENFDAIAALAEGKPAALTECDRIPHPAVMQERGFLWNWFLPWHSRWLRSNEPEYLNDIYHHDLVITRDELPDF